MPRSARRGQLQFIQDRRSRVAKEREEGARDSGRARAGGREGAAQGRAAAETRRARVVGAPRCGRHRRHVRSSTTAIPEQSAGAYLWHPAPRPRADGRAAGTRREAPVRSRPRREAARQDAQGVEALDRAEARRGRAD